MFVTISVFKDNNNICKISENIFYGLKLKEKKEYIIHFGQIEALVYIKPDASSNYSLYIPNEIFNKLYLIEKLSLNIRKNRNNLFLGPIIGIVENSVFTNGILAGKPHISTIKYSEKSEENNCFIYFFTKGEINLENKIIKGYYYNTLGRKWAIDNFPIPNIIYARQFSSEVQEIFKNFKNIKYINNNKEPINKGGVYSKLAKHLEIKQYIPDTRVYKSFEDVKEMLSKHRFVFLKSFRGSSGIEVLSIEKFKNHYEVNFYSKKDNDQKKFRLYNLSDLKLLINKFFINKGFIVQQGIRLLRYKGHKMDIRVYIQREKLGQWKVTMYLARLAKGSSNITNSTIGGECVRYDEVYDTLAISSGQTQLPTKKEVGKTTIKIAEYIEKEYGELGELGMDIGIDEEGKIWFIEANLGPCNDPCPLFYEKDTSDLYQTIVEYAMHLYD